MTSPIFIGGTGRSGTTFLLRLLRGHRRVWSIPMETRFVVDPDGVYDLAHDLAGGYSPVRGREALYRFDRLMRIHLATPGREPYLGYDLPALVGRDVYFRELDALVESLTAYRFQGFDQSVAQAIEPRLVSLARQADGFQRRLRRIERPLPPVEPARRELRFARHFADRAELLRILGGYVDRLFSAIARNQGKDVWCEKTPHNLLHAPFLLELVPQAVFVHIVRDPRAVARSLMKQPWAPDAAADCCTYVEDTYAAWHAIRPLVPDARYHEVKLEELTADPQARIGQLVAFAGVGDDFETLAQIKPEHEADWREALSDTDAALIASRLSPLAARLGYPA